MILVLFLHTFSCHNLKHRFCNYLSSTFFTRITILYIYNFIDMIQSKNHTEFKYYPFFAKALSRLHPKICTNFLLQSPGSAEIVVGRIKFYVNFTLTLSLINQILLNCFDESVTSPLNLKVKPALELRLLTSREHHHVGEVGFASKIWMGPLTLQLSDTSKKVKKLVLIQKNTSLIILVQSKESALFYVFVSLKFMGNINCSSQEIRLQ